MQTIRFALAGALCLGSGLSGAQDYPARPIQVVVPFSTGSASDVMARLVLRGKSASA